MKNNFKVLLLTILLAGCSNNISSSTNNSSKLSNTTPISHPSSTTSVESNVQSTNDDSSTSASNSTASNSSTTQLSTSTTSSSTAIPSTSSSISTQVSTSTSSVIKLTSDPYENVSKNNFYANYTEAISYEDAMYRTEHGLISGSIDYISNVPQKNTIYSGEDFLKFNNYTYTYDNNNKPISYKINTKEGTYKTIYYNAGYVVLEEVAAYIFAFGEVPPNSNYDKGSSGKKESIATWGKYGRVNIGNYSNDVIRYPNEPELPTHDSNGKAYQYIETDIGLSDYNNGSKISRGALRIVFTYKYKDGTKVTDINERYVFYTYNHYGDFEEYLNYYGGWGDRFGADTSTTSTPTPYIEALIVDKNTLK